MLLTENDAAHFWTLRMVLFNPAAVCSCSFVTTTRRAALKTLKRRSLPVPSKMYLYQGDLLIMNHTDHPRGSKLRKPSYPFRSRCSWWFRPVPSRGKSSAVVGITSTKTACQNSEIRQYTVSWWKGVCMLLSLFARLLKGLPCVSFLEAVVFCRNTEKERQMRK